MPTQYELDRDGQPARESRQDRRVRAGVSRRGRVKPAGAGHSRPLNRKPPSRPQLVIHRPLE